MTTRSEQHAWQPGWVIASVLLLIVAAVFSLAVGKYLAYNATDQIAGSVAPGQWLKLDHNGLWIRMDAIEVVHEWGDDLQDDSMRLVPGASLVVVDLTIKSQVEDPSELLCLIGVYTPAGERLGVRLRVPDATADECTYRGEAPLGVGDEFTSRVMIPTVEESSSGLRVEVQMVGESDRWVLSG